MYMAWQWHVCTLLMQIKTERNLVVQVSLVISNLFLFIFFGTVDVCTVHYVIKLIGEQKTLVRPVRSFSKGSYLKCVTEDGEGAV